MIIKNSNLSHKVVLITGATGQLGKAIAKMYAANNCSVIVSDLDVNNCKRLVESLPIPNQSNHSYIKLDVTSESSIMTV